MLNGRQASNSYLSSAAVKADVEVAHAPARRTTHVKIESPSVVTAAKKAAVETVDVESPEGSATSASDEETLVCQSKSSKTCSTDVVLSPTKSKL